MQKIQLVSCGAKRPDKRAIANMIEEYAIDIDAYTATELTGYLLEGDPVDIEVEDKNASSAFRAIRKLDIDYELID